VRSGGSPTVAATNFVDGTGAVLVLREAQGTMREADRRSRCLHLQRVRRVVRHPFRDGAVTQALVEAIAAAQPALARCRWRVPTSCQPPRGRAGCVRRAHPSTPNTTARHSDPRAASPPAADRPAPLSSQSARSSKLRRSRKTSRGGSAGVALAAVEKPREPPAVNRLTYSSRGASAAASQSTGHSRPARSRSRLSPIRSPWHRPAQWMGRTPSPSAGSRSSLLSRAARRGYTGPRAGRRRRV